MSAIPYPQKPSINDTSFLKPSASFKKKAIGMVFGIVLFILLYILILIFGVAFFLAAGYGAIQLISYIRGIGAILAVVALFALGLMVFYFTIKFVFGTIEEDDRVEMEIKQKDHPELFDFIHKVSKEIGAGTPRRIYLIPETNAFVSYTNSFWSLFLPVGKDLRIGLGLVNTLNLTEFKALIAHEFGHFSQSSLRVGSYVYRMNRTIFNLSHGSDEFETAYRELSDTTAITMMFAELASFITGSMRSIVRSAYGSLHTNFMSLSREMEYHADLVAVSAAGNEATIDMLRKIEFAHLAYEGMLSNIAALGNHHRKKISDIYRYQSRMMKLNASYHDLVMKNGVPVITDEYVKKNSEKRRLNLGDMWNSHPSLTERESSINRVSVASLIVEDRAWSLFNQPEAVKAAMTKLLYEEHATNSGLQEANEQEIDDYFESLNRRNLTFSKTFLQIYDHFTPKKVDIDKIIKSTTTKKLEDLVNDQTSSLARKHFTDYMDLEVFMRISHRVSGISTFQYDEELYRARDVRKLRGQLQNEINQDERKLNDLNNEIILYFYQRAKERNEGEQYVRLFKDFANCENDLKRRDSCFSQLTGILETIARTPSWVKDNTDIVKRIISLEKEVKELMKRLPENYIHNFFTDPKTVLEYCSNVEITDKSEVTPQSFGLLQERMNSLNQASSVRMWDAQDAIQQKQLSLI